MTLAQAIRAGARRRPQTQGSLFDKTGSCALGAAIEGMFGSQALVGNVVLRGPTLMIAIPELRDDASCPESECHVESSLFQVIVHLNDDHYWTREAIADWMGVMEVQVAA